MVILQQVGVTFGLCWWEKEDTVTPGSYYGRLLFILKRQANLLRCINFEMRLRSFLYFGSCYV